MEGQVKCSGCGWSWNKSDSSKKDMYVCHQCGKDNTMKNGGWLNKYDDGGPVQPNYNDSSVSMSEDFVGLGYNTEGRDYSPAWGGQFQEGGKLNPLSPMQQVQQAVQPTPTVPYLQTKDPAEFYKSWIQSPEYERRQLLTGYSEGEDLYMPNAAASRESRLGAIEQMTPITYNARQPSEAKPGVYGSPSYVNINPSDYVGTSKEAIQAHELAHVAGAMGEVRPGMMSSKEQEIFKKSMLPMKEPVLSGVQGSKEREASVRALEDFKHSQEPDEAKADLDALRFMMYDKGIYDITKGKKFTETDFQKAKQNLGNDRVFKRLENRMGKGNFVKLMNTIALADDQEEAPIAMGGMSIPGSVGFSYARVAGSAPSKGKYAKKTMASAQKGDNIKKDATDIAASDKIAQLQLLESPEYQYRKYLESQPQLRQAPGRGEELMRKGLGYADVATDVMQLGNFIPNPIAQTIGKAGNLAGTLIDAYQAASDVYKGNYTSAGINAASAVLPSFLGANTFRRNTMNLRPGDPLYSLTQKAGKPYTIDLNKTDTDYLELFSKVKGMKDKSLMYNRAFLGGLGAETAYDAGLIGPVKKEYGGEIPSAQNGQEMRFYQNGLDWKPKSMREGGDIIYAQEGIRAPYRLPEYQQKFANYDVSKSRPNDPEDSFSGKQKKFIAEEISDPITTRVLNVLNDIKPLNNVDIYNTIRPIEYPNVFKLPRLAYNYVMGNETEPLKTKDGKPHIAEEFWATALNIPGEKEYLKESQYKPSKSKDPNAKYYTIRDIIDERDLMNLTKNLKPGEKMKMNGLSPILDSEWYSENAKTDNNISFEDLDPLQRFTLQRSDDGSYISIYDKYDFDNPALNRMLNSFEIYDRFYLPKKKDGGSVNDKKNPMQRFQGGGQLNFNPLTNEYELPEFVVEGKDERMKEAMSQGIRKFYAHVGELMGAPQKEMMQLVTGKEQTPSEAWGFQDTGGWLDSYSSFGKNLLNTGLDLGLDPVNAIPGIGLVDDLTKGAVRAAAQNVVSKPLQRGLSPFGYEFENIARIPQNLIRNLEGKSKKFSSVVQRNIDEGRAQFILPALKNREDAWSTYLGLDRDFNTMKLVGSDDVTGLSKYEYTNPIVFEKSSPRPNPKTGAQSQRMAKGLYDVSEGRLYNRKILENDYKHFSDLDLNVRGSSTVGNDKLFGTMGGYQKYVSPDGKNLMYRDVWDLQPFSRFTSKQLPNDMLGNAIRNFEVSSLIPGAKPFVAEGKLGDIKTKFLPAQPYENTTYRYNQIKDYLAEVSQPDEDYFNQLTKEQQSKFIKDYQDGLKSKTKALMSKSKQKSFLNPSPSQDFIKYVDTNPYTRFGNSKPDLSGFDFSPSTPEKFLRNIQDFANQPVSKFEVGGVIKDDRGQWAYPGEVTEIDSNYITMDGVPYDVLGVSNTGDTKLMKPGKNYKFKGKKVTEYPVAKLGINQLDAQPMKKLNQLLNFTNNPDKDNWLDKYN